jgi:hypothetical protein
VLLYLSGLTHCAKQPIFSSDESLKVSFRGTELSKKESKLTPNTSHYMFLSALGKLKNNHADSNTNFNHESSKTTMLTATHTLIMRNSI